MPHVTEGLKEDIHDARKQLADAIGELQAKIDPGIDPTPVMEPTLCEKITEPVKNLFKGPHDDSKKLGECTKTEGECSQEVNVREELKK